MNWLAFADPAIDAIPPTADIRLHSSELPVRANFDHFALRKKADLFTVEAA